MPSLADLIVKIGVDDKALMSGLKGISDEFKGIEREMKGIERSFGGFEKIGNRFKDIGSTLTLGVTAPITGLGTAALMVGGQLETTTTAFTNLLGSGEKAKSFLDGLKNFAAKTPFEFPELTRAAQRMMAMGVSAGDVLPRLTVIGDAVAGIGGGTAEIDRVVLALGQMDAKGKVSAQEMNQLGELGIKAWEMLANKIGVSVPEAMKMAENGAIAASVAVPAILDGMNTKFAGMMDAQSKTLMGQWSNFKDTATMTLGTIGEAMIPAAKGVLETLQPAMTSVRDLVAEFTKLPQPVQTGAFALAGVAAAAGPAAYAIGTFMTSIGPLTAALITVGEAAGAAAGTGAIGALAAILPVATVAVAGFVAAWAAWKYQDDLPGIMLLKGAFGFLKEEILLVWEGAKFLAGIAKDALVPAFDTTKSTIGALLTPFAKLLEGIQWLWNQLPNVTKMMHDFRMKLAAGTDPANDLGDALGHVKSNIDPMGTAAKLAAAGLDEFGRPIKNDKPKIKQYGEAVKGVHKETHTLTEKNGPLAAAMKILQDEYDATKRAIDDYKAKLFLGRVETVNFTEVVGDLNEIVGETDQTIGDLSKVTMPPFIQRMTDAIKPPNDLKDALKTLGIQGSADLNTIATEAAKARDIVLGSNLSTDFEKKTAVYKALKAQVDAAIQAGKDVPAEQKAMLTKMETELNVGKGKDVVTASSGMFTQVSTIITNFAQDAAKILFDGDLSWGEKVKKMWGNLQQSLVSTFIEPATAALTNFINGVLQDLIGGKGLGGVLDGIKGVGKAFGDIFGAGASAGAGTASTAAGSAGSVGSVGSAAGTGLSAAVGIVTGIASAVSGIIGNFQMFGMNKSLDVIVQHTLQTANDLANLRADQWTRQTSLLGKLDDIWGTAGTGFGNLFTRAGELFDLVNLQTNVYLDRIATAVEMPPMAATSGGGVTVIINYPNFTTQAGMDEAIGSIKRNLR